MVLMTLLCKCRDQGQECRLTMHTRKRYSIALCLLAFGTVWGGTLRNPAANRWRQWRGVDNVRDFGGMTTVDGRIVRTNMIYRSQAFNDNAVCDWLTGPRLKAKYESLQLYVEFGRRNSDELVEQIDKTDVEGSCQRIAAAIRADRSKWRIGELRGTPESRRRILLETGLKTEIDLRSESECYGMTGSPLGDSVAWIHLPGRSALDWYPTEEGKSFFSRCFKIFLEPGNYPIDFHCIAGADRTGSLAFVLGAVLGVPEAELVEDYTLTSFSTSGKRQADKMRKGMKAFDGYPGKTINDRVCAYACTCGFTMNDIRKFRSIVLSEPAGLGAVSHAQEPAEITRSTAEIAAPNPNGMRTEALRLVVDRTWGGERAHVFGFDAN